ncbi:MAG: dimethylsulfonioproprionate lyase family protein [Pseudomonadota bacterium]
MSAPQTTSVFPSDKSDRIVEASEQLLPSQGSPDEARSHAHESRLRDFPSWLYLLREFHEIYSRGSPGGSKAIRTHRKKVRDALSLVIGSNPVVEPRQPVIKPVVAHLPRAFDLASRGSMANIAKAMDRASGDLEWEYGYSRVPPHLAKKYAYCEIVSPRGPVKANTLAMGFVLFAPNTTYPQHSHEDIEESYISIAGAWSENEFAVFAPGSLILNKPGHEHRITTGENDPCLLAYAWVGPGDRITDPDMKFSKTRKRRIEQGI